MSKKTGIVAASAAIVIFAVSFLIGVFMASENDDISKSEFPSPAPSETQVISPTTVPEERDIYKIVLESSSLILYKNDQEIKRITVSPEVFPSADVNLLSNGIVYDDYEAALVDWESLSS